MKLNYTCKAHVDTPEVRGPERPEGLKVKEYVKGLLEGKDLTIETFKVEKYGRYIYLARNMAKAYPCRTSSPLTLP